METKQNQIKKEVVIDIDEVAINLKATKVSTKNGDEKVVICINGQNYWGNWNFKIPVHIAVELIRILEEQQERALEKLKAQQQGQGKE